MTRRHKCLHLIPLAFLLVATTAISQSLVSSESYEEIAPYVPVARSVTPEGRVRVTVTKTKPKIHLARRQPPAIRLSAGDDDTDYYNETPEFQVGYRRPELVDQTARVQDDLSDEIKIRLLLARKRALQAHTSTWG